MAEVADADIDEQLDELRERFATAEAGRAWHGRRATCSRSTLRVDEGR